MTEVSVMWFRRDLRLGDHPALDRAASEGGVLGLFVVDPTLLDASGAPRAAYLHDCLSVLDRSMGGRLVVRHGRPADVVATVADEVGAASVFVTRDHGPYGRRRYAEVADRLGDHGRRLRGVGSNYAVEPGTIRKADDTAYAVFTPFSRKWREQFDERADDQQPGAVDGVSWVEATGDGLFDRPDPGCELPPAGEEAALERWQHFLDHGIDRYHERRDTPSVDGTSRLSPHLKWGTVHPRTLLADLHERGGLDPDGHRVFASELAWRDFYADVLFHQPHTAWSNLDTKMDAMRVDDGDAARKRFERWSEGRTGYPIVDAGMRQLLASGWMHNRVRMIVASFLVKDLHVPWQWGAQHFMDHLVDGDLASNNHGWQWAAGTGTDAAPYFRVFNPTTQQDRYDPDGTYVQRWVPEVGGDDEIEPIVDHAEERKEALARYKAVTGG
ncbi:deoxyribodipyrimidine photo-lyase [soil metagenome]